MALSPTRSRPALECGHREDKVSVHLCRVISGVTRNLRDPLPEPHIVRLLNVPPGPSMLSGCNPRA